MKSMAEASQQKDMKDNWSSEAYQHSASFVPKLATTIVSWLDVHPNDRILDIGCGDGVLDLQFAETVVHGAGLVHGIDSSPQMIEAAQRAASSYSNQQIAEVCTFEVLDANALPHTLTRSIQPGTFNKIFSAAALHWILVSPASRLPFFTALHSLLRPSGAVVFEMGGQGNIAEIHTALLSIVSRRLGIAKAREVDPWFFPDESWVRDLVRECGEKGCRWEIEKLERQYRSTEVGEGGLEGWVRLMAKQWLDAVEREKGSQEREETVKEVLAILDTVVGRKHKGGGKDLLGYVRLRVVLRKT